MYVLCTSNSKESSISFSAKAFASLRQNGLKNRDRISPSFPACPNRTLGLLCLPGSAKAGRVPLPTSCHCRADAGALHGVWREIGSTKRAPGPSLARKPSIGASPRGGGHRGGGRNPGPITRRRQHLLLSGREAQLDLLLIAISALAGGGSASTVVGRRHSR